ncbi:hypothetical protein AF72_13050 [Xylella taiwanensis]|uniref:Uncharacterized protein n=1 Tax=Xylella taiwanensis TaxID=1444770 RepID=Z9JGB7_9GAMM|nr:hypothetical protein AF72_13050 [Xylella taiwanensis]
MDTHILSIEYMQTIYYIEIFKLLFSMLHNTATESPIGTIHVDHLPKIKIDACQIAH